MTIRPTRESIINADVTNAQQKVNLGNLTDFVGDLLGDDSSSKTQAINTLGALARDMASIAAIASGTGDEMVATFDPPFTELTDQLTIYVVAPGENTAPEPTLKVDNFDALPIKNGGGIGVDIGDIAGQVCQFHYRADGSYWELQNPAIITPAKLASAFSDHLLEQEGYQILPGGLMLQWGKPTTITAGLLVVNFPRPFPNGWLKVLTGAIDGSAERSTINVQPCRPSNTGFSVSAVDVVSHSRVETTINYLAIGY